MSLKKALLEEIKIKGTITHDEAVGMARAMGRRESNCERKLRELADEDRIEILKNHKGHNIAYCLAGRKPEPRFKDYNLAVEAITKNVKFGDEECMRMLGTIAELRDLKKVKAMKNDLYAAKQNQVIWYANLL